MGQRTAADPELKRNMKKSGCLWRPLFLRIFLGVVFLGKKRGAEPAPLG